MSGHLTREYTFKQFFHIPFQKTDYFQIYFNCQITSFMLHKNLMGILQVFYTTIAKFSKLVCQIIICPVYDSAAIMQSFLLAIRQSYLFCYTGELFHIFKVHLLLYAFEYLQTATIVVEKTCKSTKHLSKLKIYICTLYSCTCQ